MIQIRLLAGLFTLLLQGLPTAQPCTANGPLADASPGCTPGKVDLSRTVEMVCSTSTRAVRPPVEETNRIKVERMAAYGMTGVSMRNVELDHLVPLELGGDSSSLDNLWPQPYAGIPWNAHVKDTLENRLHALVCQGGLDLTVAQEAIATDWTAAYETYVSH